jgi:hypothetical protein
LDVGVQKQWFIAYSKKYNINDKNATANIGLLVFHVMQKFRLISKFTSKGDRVSVLKK